MTDMEELLKAALTEYREAYAWTQRVDQDLSDAEQLVYELKGHHRDVYERLRKAEDLLTEAARQDVPMAPDQHHGLKTMMERNRVAVGRELLEDVGNFIRSGGKSEHRLRPDHNGDPSCVCGYNPSQIPKTLWPKGWDVTVNNAVRLVEAHVKRAELRTMTADGKLINVDASLAKLLRDTEATDLEWRDLDNGDHG